MSAAELRPALRSEASRTWQDVQSSLTRSVGSLPYRRRSSSTGGVAYNCTECHTYHNGDHALAGVGAKAEDATTHRQIEQFLLGKPEPKAAAAKDAKPARP